MRFVVMVWVLVLWGCGARPDRWQGPDGRSYEMSGLASWYGERFDGRLTASGQVFDSRGFTAAHLKLPFGTVVRVTEVATRRSVVVVINDRGPYKDGRVVDLARAAAEDLGMIRAGVVEVELEVLRWP